MTRELARWTLTAVAVFCGGGCIQRTLTVRSNPPGALVYLNDQEIGRTPVTRNFLWYGTYEVEVRKPGYDSVKTTAPVIAPWWQWVPIDLITEALPLTDHHELLFTLHRPTAREDDPELLIRRGEQMRQQLLSSQRGQTGPTTKPRKHKTPATKPAQPPR
jgi:hypothetical protein